MKQRACHGDTGGHPILERRLLLARSVPTGAFGFILLTVLIFGALLGPLFITYDPEKADLLKIMLPPSAEHWFGTNSYGADVFARVIYGARLDLLIAMVSVFGGLAVAMPIGALLGYAQGWWNALVMRALDFVQSFPPFVLAMALATVIGASATNVILIIGFLTVPDFFATDPGRGTGLP